MRGFRKSILVVDTDLRFGKFIDDVFRGYGAKVRVFADRRFARSHVAHSDLLILDLTLPQAAGLMLLNEISTVDPATLGRTLVVAAYPSGELRSLLGELPLIQKPVDVTELLDLVGLLATLPIKRELSSAWGSSQLARTVEGTTAGLIAARKDYATARRRYKSNRTHPGSVRSDKSSEEMHRHALLGHPAESTSERRQLIIYGKVQHVGYRFFATRVARRSGLKGWIQNMPDGTVTACVEGDRRVIDRWVGELKVGARHSHVARIDEKTSEFVGNLSDFDVRL